MPDAAACRHLRGSNTPEVTGVGMQTVREQRGFGYNNRTACAKYMRWVEQISNRATQPPRNYGKSDTSYLTREFRVW
jgi:hypothetical protein